MTEFKFPIGAAVRLKGGSVAMTVIGVIKDGVAGPDTPPGTHYRCAWTGVDGKPYEVRYHEDALEEA